MKFDLKGDYAMTRLLVRSIATLSLAAMLGILTAVPAGYAQDPFANQDAIDALEQNPSRTPAQNETLAAAYEQQAQAAKAEAAKYRKYAQDYESRTAYKWGTHAAQRSNRLAKYYEQLAADDLKSAAQIRTEASAR
ncbi:MAG: hypothetical protein ABSD30_03245 [Candidatus Binatus sp.]